MSGMLKKAVAAFIAFTPISGIIATNVQAAIAELNTKKADDAATTAAIAAAVTSAVAAAAEPASKIAYFHRTTAPAGYLKANGAAILVSAYGALATAIYCGDSANPTAIAGYRCTDPLNPSTTRNIAGAYIVLPDLRGEFPRGLDDGRGVDTGRTLGSAQSHLLGSHTHTNNDYYPVFTDTTNGSSESTHSYAYSYADTTRTTGAAGGAETRPRNVALLACIKY